MLTKISEVSAQVGAWTASRIPNTPSEVEFLTAAYLAALCFIAWIALRYRRRRKREERLLLELSQKDLRLALGRIRQRYASGHMDGEDYQRLHDTMLGRQ